MAGGVLERLLQSIGSRLRVSAGSRSMVFMAGAVAREVTRSYVVPACGCGPMEKEVIPAAN
jgi:hypothetical protein